MNGIVGKCCLGVRIREINDWIWEKVICRVRGKVCIGYEGNWRCYDF